MTSGSPGILQEKNHSFSMHRDKVLLLELSRMPLKKYAMFSRGSEKFIGLLLSIHIENLQIFNDVKSMAKKTMVWIQVSLDAIPLS